MMIEHISKSFLSRHRALPALLLLVFMGPMTALAVPPAEEFLHGRIAIIKLKLLNMDADLRLKSAPRVTPPPAPTSEAPSQESARKKKKKGKILKNSIEDVEKTLRREDVFTALSKFRTGEQTGLIDESVANRLVLALLYIKFGLYGRAENLINENLEAGEQGEYAWAVSLLAQIAYHRRDWQAAIDLFDEVDYESMARGRDESLLYHGLTLEHLRRYKDSVEILSRIAPDAPQATFAQLNIALADIRQGWWSDGEQRMERLAERIDESNRLETALVDRFYTTIGYSQLQREYFRQARHSFRKVSITGPYSNRALLGLALAAMEQEDYRLAYKLITRLRDKGGDDLVVHEAHLLAPYLLDKLNQDKKAFTLYEQSIAYYQNEIQRIEQTLTHLDNAGLRARIFPVSQAANKTEQGGILNLLEPRAFSRIAGFRNEINTLNALMQTIDERIDAAQREKLINTGDAQTLKDTLGQTRTELAELQYKLAEIARPELDTALRKRIEYMKSYISQAKFGLASLYDQAPQQRTGSGHE